MHNIAPFFPVDILKKIILKTWLLQLCQSTWKLIILAANDLFRWRVWSLFSLIWSWTVSFSIYFHDSRNNWKISMELKRCVTKRGVRGWAVVLLTSECIQFSYNRSCLVNVLHVWIHKLIMCPAYWSNFHLINKSVFHFVAVPLFNQMKINTSNRITN